MDINILLSSSIEDDYKLLKNRVREMGLYKTRQVCFLLISKNTSLQIFILPLSSRKKKKSFPFSPLFSFLYYMWKVFSTFSIFCIAVAMMLYSQVKILVKKFSTFSSSSIFTKFCFKRFKFLHFFLFEEFICSFGCCRSYGTILAAIWMVVSRFFASPG